MIRNTNWTRIWALGAALLGAFVAGCGKQDSSTDNIGTAPGPAVNNTGTAPNTGSSGQTRHDDNMPGSGMSGQGTHPGPNGRPMQGGTMGSMDGTNGPTKHSGTSGDTMPGGGMGGKR